MHSRFVLISALAASATASANLLFPGHMAVGRHLLVARQTDSTAAPTATSGDLPDDQCEASLLAIATEVPIPDSDLLDWEQSQTEIGTDPCAVASVPSSLTSQYASYTDALMSWYTASSSELYAALSACPQYAGALSGVQACTELAAPASGAASTSQSSLAVSTRTPTGDSNAASATASPTGTASGTASASSPAQTANAAPLREAATVGLVLAGVLAVAAAL
jgi:hypothetical protein